MTDKINNYNHPQRYTGEDGKDLIVFEDWGSSDD